MNRIADLTLRILVAALFLCFGVSRLHAQAQTQAPATPPPAQQTAEKDKDKAKDMDKAKDKVGAAEWLRKDRDLEGVAYVLRERRFHERPRECPLVRPHAPLGLWSRRARMES